jgi:hypothetical protein
MNFIRKTKVAIKGGPGGIGVYFDKLANVVKFHDGTRAHSVNTSQSGYSTKTADYTVVLPDDNGKYIAASLLAGITVTLPAVSAANKGHRVTVINALLPTSGAGYAIAPNASDRIGFKADNTSYVNTAATDVLGDNMVLESDGVDGWIIVSQRGIWA